MEEYILEKYKEFEFKKIQSGYRCKTYLISKDDRKYIYQIYFGQTKYQANKKEYITKLIKEKMKIKEIPNIKYVGKGKKGHWELNDLK